MSHISLILFEHERTPYGDLLGEIQIGDFAEKLHVATDYWEPRQYQEQWDDALSRLLSGAEKGAFITSLDDPRAAGGRAFLWLFYRGGADVVFQHQLLFLDDFGAPFDPHAAERWVPERETVSEEGDPISEWWIPFGGLRGEARIVGA